MTDVNGHPWPASLGPETDTQNASAVDMTREERVAVLAQVRALAESIRDRNASADDLVSSSNIKLLAKKLSASYAQIALRSGVSVGDAVKANGSAGKFEALHDCEAGDALTIAKDLIASILPILPGCRKTGRNMTAAERYWEFKDSAEGKLGAACERLLYTTATGILGCLNAFHRFQGDDDETAAQKQKDGTAVKNVMCATILSFIGSMLTGEKERHIAPYVRREYMDVIVECTGGGSIAKVMLNSRRYSFGLDDIGKLLAESRDYPFTFSLFWLVAKAFNYAQDAKKANGSKSDGSLRRLFPVKYYDTALYEDICKVHQTLPMNSIAVFSTEASKIISRIGRAHIDRIQLIPITSITTNGKVIPLDRTSRWEKGVYTLAVNERSLSIFASAPTPERNAESHGTPMIWDLVFSTVVSVQIGDTDTVAGMTSIRITCNRSPTINLVSVTVETSLTEYTTTIGVQSSSLKLFQDALLTRAMPSCLERSAITPKAVLPDLGVSDQVPKPRATGRPVRETRQKASLSKGIAPLRELTQPDPPTNSAQRGEILEEYLKSNSSQASKEDEGAAPDPLKGQQSVAVHGSTAKGKGKAINDVPETVVLSDDDLPEIDADATTAGKKSQGAKSMTMATTTTNDDPRPATPTQEPRIVKPRSKASAKYTVQSDDEPEDSDLSSVSDGKSSNDESEYVASQQPKTKTNSSKSTTPRAAARLRNRRSAKSEIVAEKLDEAVEAAANTSDLPARKKRKTAEDLLNVDALMSEHDRDAPIAPTKPRSSRSVPFASSEGKEPPSKRARKGRDSGFDDATRPPNAKSILAKSGGIRDTNSDGDRDTDYDDDLPGAPKSKASKSARGKLLNTRANGKARKVASSTPKQKNTIRDHPASRNMAVGSPTTIASVSANDAARNSIRTNRTATMPTDTDQPVDDEVMHIDVRSFERYRGSTKKCVTLTQMMGEQPRRDERSEPITAVPQVASSAAALQESKRGTEARGRMLETNTAEDGSDMNNILAVAALDIYKTTHPVPEEDLIRKYTTIEDDGQDEHDTRAMELGLTTARMAFPSGNLEMPFDDNLDLLDPLPQLQIQSKEFVATDSIKPDDDGQETAGGTTHHAISDNAALYRRTSVQPAPAPVAPHQNPSAPASVHTLIAPNVEVVVVQRKAAPRDLFVGIDPESQGVGGGARHVGESTSVPSNVETFATDVFLTKQKQKERHSTPTSRTETASKQVFSARTADVRMPGDHSGRDNVGDPFIDTKRANTKRVVARPASTAQAVNETRIRSTAPQRPSGEQLSSVEEGQDASSRWHGPVRGRRGVAAEAASHGTSLRNDTEHSAAARSHFVNRMDAQQTTYRGGQAREDAGEPEVLHILQSLNKLVVSNMERKNHKYSENRIRGSNMVLKVVEDGLMEAATMDDEYLQRMTAYSALLQSSHNDVTAPLQAMQRTLHEQQRNLARRQRILEEGIALNKSNLTLDFFRA